MFCKTAIVILNWNGIALLRRFLPSVVANSSGARIIVADNGSSDGSLKMLHDEFPEVETLDLKENHGFAKGYNVALKQVDAEYFVILNSDVELTPNWLEAPIALMDSDLIVAAVQPKILSCHDKTRFEYAGAGGGFIDRFGYPFCRGRIFSEIEEDRGQYDRQTDVFWASGACMFVRAKCFAEAGGFDPDFWAHMEEIDLCWRLKNKGYRVVYEPNSKVYHLGGGSLPYDSPRKLFLNFRNSLFMLYKNLPAKQLCSSIFARLVLDGVAAITLGPRGMMAVLKAHFSFYRSLPTLRLKRKQLAPARGAKLPAGVLVGSIVAQYYLFRRKHFSRLRGV